MLQYQIETTRNISSDTLTVEVKPAIHSDTGKLTREVWWYRYYDSVAQFRSDPAFPDHPDIVDNISEFRQTNNWASRYGARVTGLLHIPASEPLQEYRFFVSGDDRVEFSISLDESPDNLQRVCYATASTGREQFDKYSTQRSAPITLVPGERYFVELLLTQKWGSDHFAVAWTKGDAGEPQVIRGSYFTPTGVTSEFDGDKNYYASAGRDRTYYWPHGQVELEGALLRVQSTANVPTHSWQQVGGPVAAIDDPSNLVSTVSLPGVGEYVFELTVHEGGFTHSDQVTVSVMPTQDGVTGYLTRSVWFDISGREVSDLLEADPELEFPHFEDLFPGAETPLNWADYYGSRLKGFVTVPVSGRYRFWIASDDYSEIHFDQRDGSGLQRIAFLNEYSGYRRFDRRSSQASQELLLTEGIAYPITILHKEYGGSDYLSVAMEGPGTNGRELLSRGFLSPSHAAPVHNPDITISAGVDRTLLWPEDSLVLAALVYDIVDGPQSLSYQWSSGVGGVAFDAPTSPVTEVVFPGPGAYEVTITASDGVHTASDSLIVVVNDPLSPGTGGILREAWNHIPGWRVSELTEADHYQDEPDFVDIVPTFEAPTNWADNYGQRFSGYLQVPAEGDYFLLVSSDDQSELWFNANGEDPSGAQRVAYAERATGRHRWDRYSGQRSEAFHLIPGQRYFLQALHKEGGGSDYFAVAYQRADIEGSEPIVIPGVLLSPPNGTSANAFDGEIGVNAGDDVASIWPTNRFSLQGTAVDYVPGPDLLAYRWSVLSAPSGTENGVTFEFPTSLATDVHFPQHGRYVLQLTATDGFSSRSDTLVAQIGAPLAPGTGSLLCEVYGNVSGSWVTNLIESDKFPHSPDDRFQITSTEIAQNQADSYGMLIRGYLHPPVSGIYRFNLASDDWSEVFISTNSDPNNKEIACFVPAAANYYEWRKFPDYQLSRPIELNRGESYYVEIRYKEHGWRDHMSLAWLVPGTGEFEIIDGAYLSPFKLADFIAPKITLTGGSEILVEVGEEFTDPGFTAMDNEDGSLIGEVEVSGSVDTQTPGEYILRYTVRDEAGNNASEVTRKVRVVLAAGQQPTYPAEASSNVSSGSWTPPAVLSELEASRFLKQATFGPNLADLEKVRQIGIEAWIDEQLRMPFTSHLSQMDEISRYYGARNVLLHLAESDGADSMMPGSMMEMPMGRLRTDDRLWTWWTNSISMHPISCVNASRLRSVKYL